MNISKEMEQTPLQWNRNHKKDTIIQEHQSQSIRKQQIQTRNVRNMRFGKRETHNVLYGIK